MSREFKSFGGERAEQPRQIKIEEHDSIALKDGSRVEVVEVEKGGDTVIVKGFNAQGKPLNGRMMMETLVKAKQENYLAVNDEVTTEKGWKLTIQGVDEEMGMARVKGEDENGKPIAGNFPLNKLEKRTSERI